jgi:hypothetical protein
MKEIARTVIRVIRITLGRRHEGKNRSCLNEVRITYNRFKNIMLQKRNGGGEVEKVGHAMTMAMQRPRCAIVCG